MQRDGSCADLVGAKNRIQIVDTHETFETLAVTHLQLEPSNKSDTNGYLGNLTTFLLQKILHFALHNLFKVFFESYFRKSICIFNTFRIFI